MLLHFDGVFNQLAPIGSFLKNAEWTHPSSALPLLSASPMADTFVSESEEADTQETAVDTTKEAGSVEIWIGF